VCSLGRSFPSVEPQSLQLTLTLVSTMSEITANSGPDGPVLCCLSRFNSRSLYFSLCEYKTLLDCIVRYATQKKPKKKRTMPRSFSTPTEPPRLLVKTTHKSLPIFHFLTQNDFGNPRQLTRYSPHTPGRLQYFRITSKYPTPIFN